MCCEGGTDSKALLQDLARLCLADNDLETENTRLNSATVVGLQALYTVGVRPSERGRSPACASSPMFTWAVTFSVSL